MHSDWYNTSIMGQCLKALHERIKLEVGSLSRSTTGLGLADQWLLRYLKPSDYWVDIKDSKEICDKLELAFHVPSHYRRVKVWLPDIQYNIMPNCPMCGKGTHVGAHAFRVNHFSRRVAALDIHWFGISRRYICHDCKAVHFEKKCATAAIAQRLGLTVNIEPVVETAGDKTHYTYMAWNPKTLALLPYSYGDYFLAFFKLRAGLDTSLLDQMRAYFDTGMRPESFARSMLEFNNKKRTREAIKYERRMRKALELDTDAIWDPYSSFHDKSKYNGHLPSGSYLSIAHNKHHMLLEPYMTLEFKKRCGDIYSMDVQYKEAKHLCRYHGKPLLMVTVTVMNEYKEIRTQFHVVSDSHAQYERPLSAMLETIQVWGQKCNGTATPTIQQGTGTFSKAKFLH
jgi:hypothetical protein